MALPDGVPRRALEAGSERGDRPSDRGREEENNRAAITPRALSEHPAGEPAVLLNTESGLGERARLRPSSLQAPKKARRAGDWLRLRGIVLLDALPE